MTSKLYIIATPLGNKEDITLRAQTVLRELEIFFVEDTREFRKLLTVLNLPTDDKKSFSYASHNMKEATASALRFLEEGKSVGFLTDRGTPAISDPGSLLVRSAREAGFSIVPVPGASSVTALMSVAGLNDTRFVFVGFFPQGKKEREQLLEWVRACRLPLCFFESPERVRDTVSHLKGQFKGARLFIGREMTKVFEEFRWLDLDDLDVAELMEKGEYALLLDLSGIQVAEASEISRELELRLMSDKEWSKAMAARFSLASSDIYNELQRAKKNPSEN